MQAPRGRRADPPSGAGDQDATAAQLALGADLDPVVAAADARHHRSRAICTLVWNTAVAPPGAYCWTTLDGPSGTLILNRPLRSACCNPKRPPERDRIVTRYQPPRSYRAGVVTVALPLPLSTNPRTPARASVLNSATLRCIDTRQPNAE